MLRCLPASLFDVGCLLLTLACLSPNAASAQEIIPLWPGQPPGEALNVGPEEDITKPEDRLIAGQRIIKLKNVAKPELHLHLAPAATRNGSVVVICPGGGFNILAWDLEGTEVAEWLNSIGVSAVVLKYRVPTSQQNPRWLAPVQDAQRAISYTRAHASTWGLNPARIGILGFSAGGHAAARAALLTERQYAAVDEVDQAAHLPNATILIYPAWLVDDAGQLVEGVSVTPQAPPTFLVHAYDDRVSPLSSLVLATELKKANVPTEIHVFESGGHGYGLRAVEDQPVTLWPEHCAAWLKRLGWLTTP